MVDCLDVSTKWICMLTDFGNFELRTHSNISNIRGGWAQVVPFQASHVASIPFCTFSMSRCSLWWLLATFNVSIRTVRVFTAAVACFKSDICNLLCNGSSEYIRAFIKLSVCLLVSLPSISADRSVREHLQSLNTEQLLESHADLESVPSTSGTSIRMIRLVTNPHFTSLERKSKVRT